MRTRLAAAAFALACCLTAALPARGAAPQQPPAKPVPSPGDIEARFAAFLKSPTRENFLAVQQAVMAHRSYDPYSADLDDLSELLNQGKFKEAHDKLKKAMPNLLLSPRAHQYAARAAKGLGDEATAKKESEFAQQCVKGLLATGDGTEKRPIAVTRSSDEYDVVHSLKKKVSGRGLRMKGKKAYDVLQVSGGTEMWFDVTVPYGTRIKAPPK